MSHRRLSNIILCTLLLCIISQGIMYAQDYLRLTERDLQGTARYVGMSGAMTAIGGDPSAVQDNPAGLGVYQRAEVAFSLGYMHDRTCQAGGEDNSKTNRFTMPHASIVFALYNMNETSPIIFNNLMFSYRRLQTYNRTMYAAGVDGASLASLITGTNVNIGIDIPSQRTNILNALKVRESGAVNQFSFDWAMNINHRWYVGAGLRIQSYSMNSEGAYEEIFNQKSAEGKDFDLLNETSLIVSGVGTNFAAGVIYRPCQWVRLGYSIETPTIGSFNIYTSGTLSSQTDSLRYSYAPNQTSRRSDFHMPLRTSISTALQIFDKALISLQYDYAHQQDNQDQHTMRAGVEVVPVAGLYLNAGYAFELYRDRNTAPGDPESTIPIDPTFNRQDAYFQHRQYSQYASFGIGYRGRDMFVQAAYQYRWQAINQYAHENLAYNIDTQTHRVVLTLGWHQR